MKPAAPNSQNSQGFLWAGILALLAYTVIGQLDSIIAMPLRECSALLAEQVLKVLAFPVARDGVILSTESFRFDVEPACSGSTTLRVMITLSLLWCCIHPTLTLRRRFLCVLAAVPIALVANALRVSVLVSAGHHLGNPIGGFPHAAIGIAAFVFSLACLLLLTETGRGKAITGKGIQAPKAYLITAAMSLFLLYLPLFIWMGTAWYKSPLDRPGVVFFAIGLVALIVSWRKSSHSGGGRGAIALFAVSLLLAVFASLLSVNILSAFAAMLGLFAAAVFWRGWGYSIRVLPLFGAMWIGLPTGHYQLRKAIELVAESPPPAIVYLISALLVCIAVGESWAALKFWHPERTLTPSLDPGWLCLLCAVAVAIHVAASDRASAAGDFDPERLHVAFVQGSWTGSSAAIPESTLMLLGSGNALARNFDHLGDGARVELLVTATAGDRHLAHPPEYCLTGAGWKIAESSFKTDPLADGQTIEMTRLRLEREDRPMAFACWFSDGEGTTCASYKEMFAEDLRRRLLGKKSDWRLYRVMTGEPDGAAVIDAFLSEFRIAPAVSEG